MDMFRRNKRSLDQESLSTNDIQLNKKNHIQPKYNLDDYTDVIFLKDKYENICLKIQLFLNIRTEIILDSEYDKENLIINCNMLRISDHCVFKIIIFKTEFIDNYILGCKHICGDNFIYGYIVDDLNRYFVNNDINITQYESIYHDRTPPSVYHQTKYCGKTDQLISILNMINSDSIHVSIDGIKYLIEFFHELTLDIKICYQLLIQYNITDIFINIIKTYMYNNDTYDWYYVYILKAIHKISTALPDELKIIFSNNDELIFEIKNNIFNDTNMHAVNLAKEIISLHHL
jgi:hypothetical protein